MRTATKRAACGLAFAGSAVLLRPGTHANRAARDQLDNARRHLRHLGGRLRGASYRLRGARPDPDVIDTVLADRIRSALGGLEKRLDIPHIHVMVDDHVASLHGEVGSDADADELEAAVVAVSGVAGVVSYLHVGLASGDTRPSAGRAIHPPSAALEQLAEAAVDAGVDPGSAQRVARAILATFAERIPVEERDHVSAHLPADVRPMFTPPRRQHGHAPARTVQQFVTQICAVTGELTNENAQQAVARVLGALRALVPEEDRDISAVLPEGLKALWQQAKPTSHRR